MSFVSDLHEIQALRARIRALEAERDYQHDWGMGWKARAEKAEAELATLKFRIAKAMRPSGRATYKLKREGERESGASRTDNPAKSGTGEPAAAKPPSPPELETGDSPAMRHAAARMARRSAEKEEC